MENGETSQIEKLQERILQMAAPRSFSARTATAFRTVPRHAFVKSYRLGDQNVIVTPENLSQHLLSIYNNGVLTLWKDSSNETQSTISQPTLVLGMLDMLQLSEGQTVFELGAGSGWNAALMGHLVGPSGRVFSVEIIPEMAETARKAVADLGIANVEIISGDGGAGFARGAPFDRAVFTAGSHDVPLAFHEQVRVGGLLLMVLKVAGGGDQLFLLEKKADCFESRYGAPCAFVSMTGKHAYTELQPISLASLPEWPELRSQEIERRFFLWAGNTGPTLWTSIGIRSFLTISEPLFRVFHEDEKDSLDSQHWFYGIYDPVTRSLAIARNGMLISYGGVAARDLLMTRLHQWVDHGMPCMAEMNLRVFPSGSEIEAKSQQWVVQRSESSFVWSLKNPSQNSS